MSPRHTGPSQAVVRLVRERDGDRCVRCGRNDGPLTTQHRIARGMGGTRRPWINLPSNLLTLCGSGTTGCHGWVEGNPVEARRFGWALGSGRDPQAAGVLYVDGWWLLDDDGNRDRWREL